MTFDYVLEKIRGASWQDAPFRHIEIENLFTDDHFAEIVRAQEIDLERTASDETLVAALEDRGWKPIPFPGTTKHVSAYLKWRKTRRRHGNQDTCEGYGITYRLFAPRSSILQELDRFQQSDAFRGALLEKFGIDPAKVTYDAGIQKYLDGYEISPHPDIRKKAMTYMVNINPAANSEDLDYHTHYMTFENDRRYVQEYWRYNERAERCWVPWSWCRTAKQQVRNNSIVLFAPTFDTLHAVKARYDHLETQRTQLYGNFWFDEETVETKPEWRSFVVAETAPKKMTKAVPDFVKRPVQALRRGSPQKVGRRAV